MSRIERIPSDAYRRIGKLGRWATDGACLLREGCPPPLEPTPGLHPAGYYHGGAWTWKLPKSSYVRRSVAHTQELLESVRRIDVHSVSMLLAPRFARVVRAGVAHPVVIKAEHADLALACGVWRDGELIAVIAPCLEPYGNEPRIDIRGRPVRYEVIR